MGIALLSENGRRRKKKKKQEKSKKNQNILHSNNNRSECDGEINEVGGNEERSITKEIISRRERSLSK